MASRTTEWRRRRAAAAEAAKRPAVLVVADRLPPCLPDWCERRHRYIESHLRRIGLRLASTWPRPRGRHLLLDMGATVPSRAEALPTAHDPCCPGVCGGECDCDDLEHNEVNL